MKFVILIGDGMSDAPHPDLGGQTPLMVSHTPNLDRMVRTGIGGHTLNVPEGFSPGSDIANLAVLGYDVRQAYTGRSPLEAAAMGVELSDTDVAFRCNLVTLSDDYATMRDFSAGHIGSDEAAALIRTLDAELGSDEFSFHPGVSYRHLLVWHGGQDGMKTTPPHDITDRPTAGHLPAGPGADALNRLMTAARPVLQDHPANARRRAAGQSPANAIWFWGQGRRPALQRFRDRYGLRGGMISAVDLMHGIAANIGFERLPVEGATGWIDTNYAGKAQACIDALAHLDIVCVHVEAPDEAGHAGRMDYKIKAIEDFDARIVGPVLEALEARGDYRALALPDHPTPVALRTHTREPVPFALCGTGIVPDSNLAYSERLLQTGSEHYDRGFELLGRVIGR